MKKKHGLFLILIICSCLFSSSQTRAQAFRAVNDTVVLYPLIPKMVNLLENDTIPPGDSVLVTVTFPIDVPIYDTNYFKGFFVFKITQWGGKTTYNGTCSVRDYTIHKTSVSHIFLRVPDHSYDSLDINNVNAAITSYGNEFELFGSGKSLFKIPKGSQKGTFYNTTLWIGGRKEDSTLCFAGEINKTGPNIGSPGLKSDFFAGPVMDSVNYSVNQDTVWNRTWKIRRSDIESYKAHWSDPGYIIPRNILTWPGNGNTALGQAARLAPFHDRNNDGTYDPADGDYPDILGDESVFVIYNDDRDIHKDSQGKKMKLEFHLMAYAFDIPGDSAFKNTIFFHYRIFNRSDKTYYNTFIGTFADLDIGIYSDDYISCDVGRNSIIGYNGFPVDGNGEPASYGAHPPAQSLTILGGPYLDPLGQDRPKLDNTGHPLCNESWNGTGFGDSIANNERYGLTHFMSYFFSSSTQPLIPPETDQEYYRSMQSAWGDSVHLFYGGEGHPAYGGYGPDCRFIFPGESDSLNWGSGCRLPDGPVNWTMKTAGMDPNDIKGMGSMGPFTFRPGDVQDLDIAFVFARDYDGQDTLEPSVAKLRQMIDIVRNSYSTGKLPGGNSFFGINEIQNTSANGMKIYPNPADDRITIEIKSQILAKSSLLSVYDIEGRLMFAEPIIQRSTSIDISQLARGVYILKLTDNSGSEVSRFVKE